VCRWPVHPICYADFRSGRLGLGQGDRFKADSPISRVDLATAVVCALTQDTPNATLEVRNTEGVDEEDTAALERLLEGQSQVPTELLEGFLLADQQAEEEWNQKFSQLRPDM
jgi:hypothetical protein